MKNIIFALSLLVVAGCVAKTDQNYYVIDKQAMSPYGVTCQVTYSVNTPYGIVKAIVVSNDRGDNENRTRIEWGADVLDSLASTIKNDQSIDSSILFSQLMGTTANSVWKAVGMYTREGGV